MITKLHPKTIRTQATIKEVKSLIIKENTPTQRYIASKLKMFSDTWYWAQIRNKPAMIRYLKPLGYLGHKTNLRKTASKNTERTLENGSRGME
ncbi:hypothetical protein TNCV_3520861 [Trichonephila clavipes]|nr:hypothetical protein TNCV_3520861 [Trichonephila clavipes]